MADLSIRQDFLEGTQEIFTTLFNKGTDAENDGILYYELSPVTIPDIYGEQKNKIYKTPVRLVAQVISTPSQENYDISMLKDYCKFVVPCQDMLLKGLSVLPSDIEHMRQGFIEYRGVFYRIDNILPKAFVEDTFLFYHFECTQDHDIEDLVSGYYDSITKLKDYLFEVSYSGVDYKFAYDYFEKSRDYDRGACTSVRKNNLYGRNYDWIYNNQAEFIVHNSRHGDKFASIGVAGSVSELTESFVQSGVYSDAYRILPFRLLDGINEYGVVANINVVPLDKGENTAIPLKENKVTLSISMVVRYILDSFKSAKEAVEYLRDYATIYFPEALHEMGYEIHLMVLDSERTFLVEFIENKTVVTEMTQGANSRLAGKPFMTNFYLSDVIFNEDGKVFTPETQTEEDNAFDTNNITLRGSGLERYNLIVDYLNSVVDKESMSLLLEALKYTHSYPNSLAPSSPLWYTEFVYDNVTVKSAVEEFSHVLSEAEERFSTRSRDTGLTWQTVHSSIYDIDTLTLYVKTQEEDEEFEFTLEKEL